MGITVETRPALAEEAPSLAWIKRRCTIEIGDHIEELLAIPGALDLEPDHLQHVLVAEDATGIVGFVTLLPPEDGVAEIEDLFVDPDFWRRGVATSLMGAAEERALAQGAYALHVVSGESARPFYESCGFEYLGMTNTQFSRAPELHKRLRLRHAERN